MRAAVLDMGSTSFHLLVADVDHDVVEVHRDRAYLDLGHMVGRHGEFSDEAMEEAVRVAADFHRQAEEAGATAFVALATSAIRDAANGAELAARLEAETSWPVHVIDGDEEARLVFLGQQAALAGIGIDSALDLGGGSLELAVATDDGLVTTSLPFGTGRVLSTLGPDDPADLDALATVTAAVQEALAPYRQAVPPGSTAGISGGSVRALARVAAAEAGGDPGDAVNRYRLPRKKVADLAGRLSRLDRSARGRLPGAGRRGDTLHVAAVVVAAAVEALGIEALVVSEWGLREGALLELADAAGGADDDPALRRHTAMAHWVEGTDGDVEHGRHVAAVASWLFQLTQAHHRLGPEAEELLELAAVAHATRCTGAATDGRQAATLLEQGPPRALLPARVERVVEVLRLQRRRSAAGPHDVRVLAALLDVADALDTDRDRPIRQLRLVDDDGELRLLADGTGDLRAACTAARAGARALAELLGRKLVVVPASA